jgi:hypothetical protein
MNMDFIQDYSIQAASLVFNVSAFFHGFGFVFSTDRKRIPWFLFVAWDTWLWLVSPLTFLTIFSIAVHLLMLPLLVSSISGIAKSIKPSPWKLATLLLLPFSLLEAVRYQVFVTPLFIMPKTTSSLADLDQFVSLMTAIVVVVYQWKLWHLLEVLHKLRTRFGWTPVKGNSLLLESRESIYQTHIGNT